MNDLHLVPPMESEPPLDDTLPPQDIAAERAVLGSVLLSKAALNDVLELVTPGDFYRHDHEFILHAVIRLHGRNEPVDAITVGDELGVMGEPLRASGGLSYLHQLAGSVPVASNADYYARIVSAVATRRRLVEAAVTIGTAARKPGEVADLVAEAHRALDSVTVHEPAAASHEQDVYAAVAALDAEPGMPTPWHDLTEAIGGWRPGGLYYVGARPGAGKSVVGIQAALDCARRGRRAVIASLEMSKSEIYHRMLSSVGSIDSERVMHRRLIDADWQAVDKAAAHIARLPLTVDDRSAMRVMDIRAMVRLWARREPVGLVVVDYLQLMSSGSRVESRQTEVAEFSRQLKVLARELEVPVLALSQLNRGPEHRADKKPTMADFRESGALEQDADVAILLHRDPDVPGELKVLVEKNRHGAGDKVLTLRWEGQFSRASDLKWSPAGGAR